MKIAASEIDLTLHSIHHFRRPDVPAKARPSSAVFHIAYDIIGYNIVDFAGNRIGIGNGLLIFVKKIISYHFSDD